ncbi:unnamed protein product [Coregonus sp. 'balchen']|nr:unnamed protein product [Coregonus sp. 'balchen']
MWLCSLPLDFPTHTELLAMFNPAMTSTLPSPTNLYSESSQHRALVEQAKELPLSLRSNQAVELDTDWKLVMLFVQVDELCVCQDQVSETIKAAVQQVDLALQVLQSQLKRTIVNVALWYGEYDTGFRYQNRMCQCMEEEHEGEFRLLRAILTQVLQESLDRHLVEKQWYSNRDDFTVLLQDAPFITANPASVIDRPFLRTESNSPSDHTSEPSPLLDPIMGTHMPCEDRSPSNSPPTSVHALRPGDIKVIAAVGDSLTAGNGVGSGSSVNNLLDVQTQYRGLSWSIGGDENLTTVTTLPNILREFNPFLTGYSVAKGKEHTPQAFLNQAVAGEKAKDIPDQVRALVARMKNDSRVNFQEDWKVITLFIGGNDMCEYCYNSLFYSTDNYVHHIRESLDYLHKQVPRALVNLVEPLYIPILRQMHSEMNADLKCPTWLASILCPCVISPTGGSVTLRKLNDLNRDYQRGLHELVESGRYDTHNNFTVVLQPFLRDIIIPVKELEPLGKKTTQQDFNDVIPVKCPSKTSPFVRTYVNSNYTYEEPTPTPPPITNWGSDFSCGNFTPSTSVPTSAVGAKAKNVLQLNTEYKGVSWSIGGDQTLDTVTTLPNILKKFNPSLQGFSKGQGWLQNNGFNMAKVNFEQDWKLVTLFVGSRDLCDYCMDQNNLTPKNYSENLMLSLDMLYKEVPRVMVNVIEVLEMNPLRSVRKNDLFCNLIQRKACPCFLNPEDNSPELTEVRRINQEYQIETERLVSGGRYDGREDFTVVIGKPDLSFFSVDCFHISERAHAEMAIALWNNMLEPVGMKQDQPFIFTKVNSLPSPPVTTTTPVPVTNTSTPSPVPRCDSSIPVWVPVLLGITGLLIGCGITWLLMSCRERQNKRKMGEKEVKMKGTGF